MRGGLVLIGPAGVGKSTVGKLLAEALDCPQRPMDVMRSKYYAEIGYDPAHAKQLRTQSGLRALYEYWKPFEAHAVERILQDYSECVFDFGAGHSVFEDPALFERVRRALANVRFVVLLLPSADPDESIRLLRERLPAAARPADVSAMENLNEHFVRHPSNLALATHVVYTKGKAPAEVLDEILAFVRV